MKNALSFVPTIRPNLRRLRIPFLSLTPFAHRYPSQTLLRLKIYQKLFFTHMHNWLSLYICRKNTYQSAVIRSISKCLAPKFASLFTDNFTYIYVYHTNVSEAGNIYKNPNVISPKKNCYFYFALGLHP